ncbi:competence type IV pilus minor pilin ComGD [Staphylococcus sp. IVB6240]|uniref:competence type IV pilus minor pilin ComGD n=1 Tax=Staphylococcus sp. IVB6240 TaxID=2989771 RepID=UPI0021D16FC8|nr:competence type IV pilus minor pilin ComGD [Staphylococcus sp. IVB6240]
MARPLHHKNVFTLVEMLIVMCVISITLYLFMTIKSSMYSQQNIKDQIKLLTSKIDYYQAYAIKHRQTVLMVFRPNKNNIRVVFQNGQKDIVIPLSPLHLDEGSTLNTIAFDKDGNILKFGKLKFQYMQYHFDLIFHIEQGRYRIVSNE